MDSNPDRIDLHVHSTASDGTETPRQILQMAERIGLSALAITDHDTVDGARQALEGPVPESIAFVPGVEISVSVPDPYADSKGTLHILGYFIDLDNSDLNDTIGRLQDARANRNPQIIERLKKLGVELDYQEILDAASGGQPGRPHFAQVLVAKGLVANVQEAFSRYFGKGRPAYVEKYRPTMEETLAVIHAAKGLPVLAHPFSLKMEGPALERFVKTLKNHGLEGIEVLYPEHSPGQVDEYLRLAKRHGLIVTGGTDYHGGRKPGIQLGFGKGNLHVPHAVYEKLLAEHRRQFQLKSA